MDANRLIWLSVSLIMAILPHAHNIPGWYVIFFVILALSKIVIVFRAYPESGDSEFSIFRVISILLIIAAVISVYGNFGTLIGRDAGISLLVILTGFKLHEIRNPRDFYIANFLGYFLIITNFFYTQTILTALYMLLTLLVMTGCLINFNDSKKFLSITEQFRYATILLLQAVPLTIILFLFFPRVEGPLWGMPKDAHAGKIGLSDKMTPGAISELAQSDAVAFRVSWEDPGNIPPNSRLYWRGPVFWYHDGISWTPGRRIFSEPKQLQETGHRINYTVTIEPNNQRWVFALELPDVDDNELLLTHDYLLLTRKPINNPRRYTLSSFLDYRMAERNEWELFRGLQLPDNFHPRTVALAKSWQSEGLTPEQFINRTLRWFNEEEFFYTLNPPLLTNDNVDEFLFNTRKGFCEHYTGAFVTLMRAAGIPARVVTGYQGGTYNPVGNYLIVYQRNAHAWAEVWLENKGWIRIDPTSAVSPERINQGIENALPGEVVDTPSILGRSNLVRQFWFRLRYSWDSLNNQWNQWVISYGPEKQIEFFRQFGFKKIDWRFLSAGMIVISLALLVFFARILFRDLKKVDDQALLLYKKFCRKLARKGLNRRSAEGPQDFAKRAANKFVQLRAQIADITSLYIAVRYADQKEVVSRLKSAVNSFHP